MMNTELLIAESWKFKLEANEKLVLMALIQLSKSMNGWIEVGKLHSMTGLEASIIYQSIGHLLVLGLVDITINELIAKEEPK
jgi:predicted transcriptional regulator